MGVSDWPKSTAPLLACFKRREYEKHDDSVCLQKVNEVYDSLDKDYAWILGFPFLLKAVGA